MLPRFLRLAQSPFASPLWLNQYSFHLKQVHGGDSGDADELRLLSDSSTVVNLRGHGGSLSFHDTKVRVRPGNDS